MPPSPVWIIITNESYKCYSRYIYDNEASLPSITKSYSRYLYKQWMQGFVSGIRDSFDERKNNPEYELMLITPTEVLIEYNKLPLHSGREMRKTHIYKQEVFDAGYIDGKGALDKKNFPESEEMGV